MDCRRSHELDLADFLDAPRDAAFEEFRRHYPTCRDCAAEVRAWTELRAALDATHPEPEVLARLDALPAAERAAVQRHAARCPSCREELSLLGSFAPERLAAPAAPEREAAGWGLADLVAGLARLLWHPAFAYALVGLLLLPLVQRVFTPRLEADVPATVGVFEGLEAAEEVAEEKEQEQALAQGAARKSQLARGAPAAETAPAPAQEPAPAPALRMDRLADEEPPAEPGVARDAARSFGAPSFAAVQEQERQRADLRLESFRTGEVRRATLGAQLALAVPVPPQAAGAGAWLSVRSADGARELRERVLLPAAGAGPLRVELPASWLAPGDYRVELSPESGERQAFRLRVLP